MLDFTIDNTPVEHGRYITTFRFGNFETEIDNGGQLVKIENITYQQINAQPPQVIFKHKNLPFTDPLMVPRNQIELLTTYRAKVTRKYTSVQPGTRPTLQRSLTSSNYLLMGLAALVLFSK